MKASPCHGFLMIGLAFITLTAPAYAQDHSTENAISQRIQASEDKNFITLSYENDLIGNGKDGHYTSGVRATWFNVNTPMPDFARTLAENIPSFSINDTTSTFYTFGQNIFTPDDITIAAPQNNDRPWAGFLYASAGLATITKNHIDELELTLGVVGPQALGEQVQKSIHKNITSSPTPEGWDNQLDFEPGLIVSAQRRWPAVMQAKLGPLNLRAEPNINASLGNIYTYAGAGMNFTLTPYGNRFQDAPPRVRPAMPGSGYFERPEEGWSWLIFAGVDGRAMARNVFLDGNTFSDSPDADKNILVGDAVAGAALTFGSYRLSYSYNLRTKEFEDQTENSAFGSLSLSAKF